MKGCAFLDKGNMIEKDEKKYESPEFIERMYHTIMQQEGVKTSEDIMKVEHLTKIEYEAFLEAMEKYDAKMHMRFLVALKSRNTNKKEQESKEPKIDNKMGEIIFENEISIATKDLSQELSEQGAIKLEKNDGKPKPGQGIRSIEERLEGIELSQILREEMIEGEDIVIQRYHLSISDIKEIHDLVRIQNKPLYKEWRERQGKATVIVREGEVIATQKQALGKPLIEKISMIKAIEILIKSGEIKKESVMYAPYLLRNKISVQTFYELINAGKLLPDFLGIEEAELKILELDKYRDALAKMEEQNPEKESQYKEVGTYISNTGKPDIEYEAALVLYDFVKADGPIKHDMPLERVGEIIAKMAGERTSSNRFISDEVCSMVSNRYSLYRLFYMVKNLDQVKGPKGYLLKEPVKISPHVQTKEREPEVKESLQSVLGDTLGRMNWGKIITDGIVE